MGDFDTEDMRSHARVETDEPSRRKILGMKVEQAPKPNLPATVTKSQGVKEFVDKAKETPRYKSSHDTKLQLNRREVMRGGAAAVSRIGKAPPADDVGSYAESLGRNIHGFWNDTYNTEGKEHMIKTAKKHPVLKHHIDRMVKGYDDQKSLHDKFSDDMVVHDFFNED